MTTLDTHSTGQIVAPYGSWETPFTGRAIVKDTIGYGTIVTDNEDIYWIETRPSEGGRHVIVKRSADGKISDVLPRDFNARSRVHEYGGGAFTVHQGVIYFVQYDDQQLYKIEPGEHPQCLNTRPGMRFAEPVYDRRFDRLIAVAEDHRKDDEEAVNSIVSISVDGTGEHRILAGGFDFYSSPRISPDGKRMAWVCWKHPNMPWDSTQIFMADFNESGALKKPLLIAGGDGESIIQPEWSPDGLLYFVSDKSGWWNIERLNHNKIEVVHEMPAEFGRPTWHLGYSQYTFISQDEILASYHRGGFWQLAIIDTITKELKPINSEVTDIWWLKSADNKVVFRGASPQMPQAIIAMDLRTKAFTTLASSTAMDIERGMISAPESIEFPTGNGVAYGLFYRPKNQKYRAPENEKPPLIVKVHGGPTGIASTILNLEIQYWTSRGFAYLDMNYRGSVGFGRTYRERLNTEWGIADVEDCVSGASYLVRRGEVDPNRLVITGGSAGGYTALCAVTFTKTFKAGASYYGICDLEAMTRDTHKFESRYLDNLIGPYPKRRDVYRERSAIHHADKIACPLIFFQGLEDKIVPPNQTIMMMETLKKKGIPVAGILYEGEQHGFRRAETIRRSLDAELYFYSRIFEFNVPADIMPIEIEHMN